MHFFLSYFRKNKKNVIWFLARFSIFQLQMVNMIYGFHFIYTLNLCIICVCTFRFKVFFSILRNALCCILYIWNSTYIHITQVHNVVCYIRKLLNYPHYKLFPFQILFSLCVYTVYMYLHALNLMHFRILYKNRLGIYSIEVVICSVILHILWYVSVIT